MKEGDIRIIRCPRCGGTGEEPGCPPLDDGSIGLCNDCNGTGEIEQVYAKVEGGFVWATEE